MESSIEVLMAAEEKKEADDENKVEETEKTTDMEETNAEKKDGSKKKNKTAKKKEKGNEESEGSEKKEEQEKNSYEPKLLAEGGKDRICMGGRKPLVPGKLRFVPSAPCDPAEGNRGLSGLLMVSMGVQPLVLVLFNEFCRIGAEPLMGDKA